MPSENEPYAGPQVPPRMFPVVAGLLVAVSLIKGLRMPGQWAATHMTFNYEHGFVRRGLVGELLRLVSGGRAFKYYLLASLAIATFLAAAALMARAVRRAVKEGPSDAEFAGAVCVVAASPALVFLAHIIGYFDHLGLMMTLAFLLWSSRSSSRYAPYYVAAPMGIVMALVHESLVPMFTPVVLFALICHVAVRTRDPSVAPRARAGLWTHAAVATGSALAACAAVSSWRP